MSLAQLRFSILLAGLCFVASFAAAEEITTIDGAVYSSTSFRRSGNAVLIKVSADNGGMVEMGLPISRITHISFAEPLELAKAQAAASAGNATDVISLTDDFMAKQGDFKSLPGSWWPQMAKLRLMALVAAERDADAAALAREIGSLNTPADIALSRGGTLFDAVASGDTAAVVLGAKALPKAIGGDGTALAQIALGRVMLKKNDFVQALRAFLSVKVFYPSLTLLQPEALFGAANAYVGLGDSKRALQSLKTIETNYPHSIQAPKVKKMEENLSKS